MKPTNCITILSCFVLAVTQIFAESSGSLLSNTRQLTFSGARAGEGYFGASGKKIVFQSERDPDNPFFQIYLMDLETGDIERVSPGMGKTTCAWIHPDGEKVLYASTHANPEATRQQEEEIAFRKSGKERRYSWDYDPEYEIYAAPVAGGEPVNLTKSKGYDAEGSYSPDGEWIAFASNRHAYNENLDADTKAEFKKNPSHAMEIYLMRSDGSGLRRLTDAPGYDGGPFFNADGSRICWRRFSEDGTSAEIYTMATDGSDVRQITRLGAMSWAPFFHPSGEYLIFATNLHGFANFELYLVGASGVGEPVRVTSEEGFDGLPAFSPDGKMLAWTSNRTPGKKSQIFMAEWDHGAAQTLLSKEQPEPDVPDIAGTVPAISSVDMERHIRYLASAELGGRLTGTPGELKATAYVANAFASMGISPAGDDGSYYDAFEFTAGVALGDDNRLGCRGQQFEAGKDWTPLSFSLNGDLGEAGVVFAGYGIEAPEEQVGVGGETLPFYSSYVHLDVEDKWVMVFRYMPEGFSQEEGRRFARYSSLRYKALVARRKGAKGIIVVSGPNANVKSPLVPLAFDASLAGSGVGAVSVTDGVAEKILGRDLKELQDAHDSGEMQAGFVVDGSEIVVDVDVEQEKKNGRNVIGRLSCGTEGAPAVVIGAHVDHLGSKAGASSRAKEEDHGKIHYGADDNASGVAGLMEIAQKLAAQKEAGELVLQRDIIFAAWSGEELGLLGSAHYVGEQQGSGSSLQDRFVACLNMDMIGRLEKALVLQGAGSSPYWAREIERRNAPIGLPLVIQNDSYLPTDATSFYIKGVPVLNAFTGAHEDYHTPADTPDKINYVGAEKVTRFMGLITRGLAVTGTIPLYKAMEKPENQGVRTGLRAYLGTVPDYSQGDVSGVKLSGVSARGPAEKAGLKGGDIIISLGGQEIKNIYDYTYAIGALKIGQEVEVSVIRDKKEISLQITPDSRD